MTHRTPTTHVSAYLLLRKGDKICLLLRQNTGYLDGHYGLISGHVEAGEAATEGMIREAEEEAGLKLLPKDLKVVHTMHRKTERFGIDLFFECDQWCGPLINCEPKKCAEINFFPLSTLPKNTIPYIAYALKAIAEGKTYSELGW